MARLYARSATKINTKETRNLDVLFSEYIRRRAITEVGGCERCLTPKYNITNENGDIFPAWKHLQCSHFHGRASRSVRWDEDNASGLCGACHIYVTAHPIEHVEWFKERLGDRFDLLQARARTPARYIDREAIKLYYKAKIEELK